MRLPVSHGAASINPPKTLYLPPGISLISSCQNASCQWNELAFIDDCCQPLYRISKHGERRNKPSNKYCTHWVMAAQAVTKMVTFRSFVCWNRLELSSNRSASASTFVNPGTPAILYGSWASRAPLRKTSLSTTFLSFRPTMLSWFCRS